MKLDTRSLHEKEKHWFVVIVVSNFCVVLSCIVLVCILFIISLPPQPQWYVVSGRCLSFVDGTILRRHVSD
jgi:hypothetical protein